MNNIKITDILCGRLDQVTKFIEPYTTLIMIPVGDRVYMGSGTFTHYQEKLRILCAAHVIKPLVDLSEKIIRIPHPVTTNLYDIPVASLKCLSKTDSKNITFIDHDDPDFAFLELSSTFDLEFLGKKSWDLARERQLYFDRGNVHDYQGVSICQFFVIAGVPSQNQIKEYDEVKNHINIILRDAGCYFCDIIDSDQKIFDVLIDGTNYSIDVIKIHISENCSQELPKSFRGLSGGGLWQVTLESDSFNILDIQLIGIQISEYPTPAPNSLCCRGPISLYESFLPYVDVMRKV
jgi:hypothetical protein